jgi:hypothetical protein
MNRLSTQKRAEIIGLLVEGNSLRATQPLTGASINTVSKRLADIGEACTRYQDEALTHLPCRTIQCDEIWAFVYSKAKNVPADRKGEFGYGDVWTWTAICADTKLVPSWLVGEPTVDDAWAFLSDQQGRLAERVQITSDGLKLYVRAVDLAFGDEVDFAQLHKIYGTDLGKDAARRYSPAVCTGTDVRIVTGDPDPGEISTSYVECEN